MKGFTRDNKFIPMTDYKKVTRKSRDPETKGIKIQRKSRDNNAEILRNNIISFNRQFPVKITYGSDGSGSQGLKYEGTHSFIAGVMTRAEAIKTLQFTERFIDRLPDQSVNEKNQKTLDMVDNNLNEVLKELKEIQNKDEFKTVPLDNSILRLQNERKRIAEI